MRPDAGSGRRRFAHCHVDSWRPPTLVIGTGAGMAVTIPAPEFGGPSEEDVAFARRLVEAASTYLRECQKHVYAAAPRPGTQASKDGQGEED
jgi:hypothetical protein